uniref:Histidine-containing phosphotransfer protein n=1 Tax=Gossypium raimondii TaxID=29730 RepID=A0A0D2UVH0_GOSRA|nr:hypothetical protein B456_011G182900 [Gossypium raimondii]
MEVGQMQRRLVDYTKSLFMEGFLDAQFLQLQQLQDESNPDFVVEVVSLFFDDSEKLLNDLTMALDQPNVDFKKVDAHVHQLKGSSSRYKALKQYDPTVSLQKLIKLVRSNHSRKTRLQNMKNEQNLGMFKLFD